MGWYMTINHRMRMSICVYMHILTKHMYIMFHIISMEELNVYLQQLSYIANHTIARANNGVLDLF